MMRKRSQNHAFSILKEKSGDESPLFGLSICLQFGHSNGVLSQNRESEVRRTVADVDACIQDSGFRIQDSGFRI